MTKKGNLLINKDIQDVKEKLSLTEKKFDKLMKEYFLSIFKKMKSFKELKKQLETLKINGADQETRDRVKTEYEKKLKKEFVSIVEDKEKSVGKEHKKMLKNSPKKKAKKYIELSSKLHERMALWLIKTSPLKHNGKKLS